MNRPRDELFATAALTANQHAARGARDAGDARFQFEHRLAFADEFVERRGFIN